MLSFFPHLGSGKAKIPFSLASFLYFRTIKFDTPKYSAVFQIGHSSGTKVNTWILEDDKLSSLFLTAIIKLSNCSFAISDGIMCSSSNYSFGISCLGYFFLLFHGQMMKVFS